MLENHTNNLFIMSEHYLNNKFKTILKKLLCRKFFKLHFMWVK